MLKNHRTEWFPQDIQQNDESHFIKIIIEGVWNEDLTVFINKIYLKKVLPMGWHKTIGWLLYVKIYYEGVWNEDLIFLHIYFKM